MQLNSIPPINAIKEEHVPPGQEGNSINDVLPFELISKILAHLPPSADPTTSQVCKLWNLVVQKLPDPTLIVFGKEAWKDYYNLEVEGEVPPLPKKIYQITRSLRCRLAGKDEAPPCTAILMPKGLTLNKLLNLVQNPIKGNSMDILKFWPDIFDKYGDEQVKKSYWFVITNDVIEGSRNKSYAYQAALVRQKTGSECELPKLLEAYAYYVMHHTSSGKYLFVRDPWTCTCCQGQVDGYPYYLLVYEYPYYLLVVGGFTTSGLERLCRHRVDDRVGAAACRKFC